jgi:hypothetical protein
MRCNLIDGVAGDSREVQAGNARTKPTKGFGEILKRWLGKTVNEELKVDDDARWRFSRGRYDELQREIGAVHSDNPACPAAEKLLTLTGRTTADLTDKTTKAR